ncbi:MAG: thioredoxin [Firmicutes bacterium]|nr:thioredoxin [Bacillota bacterium]
MKNNRLTAALLLFAAACIAIGLLNHQPAQVLMKAVTICLECVGIG